MDAVVFIGINEPSRQAWKEANLMGYYTFILSDKYIITRQRYLNQFKCVDVKDESQINVALFEILQVGFTIKAIVSLCESTIMMASKLHQKFCHSFWPVKPVYKMSNKYETRECLRETKYNIEYQKLIKENDGLDVIIGFPLILKSIYSKGSKYVRKILNHNQLLKESEILFKETRAEELLIEQFVEGRQFLVEVMVFNGFIQLVAIFEQEVTYNRRFIVTGYASISEKAGIFQILKNITETIVDRFGMNYGSCHLELRYTKNGWKLIEINPRISGGEVHNMIKAAYGFSYVREILKVHLNEMPNLQMKHNQFVYTFYFIAKSDGVIKEIKGEQKARCCEGVVNVTFKNKVGDYVREPLSMGDRLGYVMAVGAGRSEAKQRALLAASFITIDIC
ncbi:ATP-grasp domain-containing protein [Bacillus carboniphilus]|uniref:ATP-grasp domain-containing protein n=1 Tax=Bacillus carboniphilus TaxID=86663 RepID=A0ABY9JXG1_9BACI|nr:ATP-grasp domain-containing protein [Bacillus carboniphilus]WLR43125.1 ATP-grasp domain-containing protein [Bacillus carboniphilus]